MMIKIKDRYVYFELYLGQVFECVNDLLWFTLSWTSSNLEFTYVYVCVNVIDKEYES